VAEPTQAQSLVIRRELPAKPDVVWDMWTDPEHFAAWYGPAGATVQVVSMDVRVGGSRQIGMSISTPDGPMLMWFTGEHLEVEPTTRLAYSEAMSNRDGAPLSREEARLPHDHPITTRIIVDLSPSENGTTMTVTHDGIAPDSPGASGWGMAFDKLGARLSQPPV
jgi:uncharacterized protein YndB with AHSA1/START domain